MPKWTEEQESAIYESGENIIVSAGAGSGKTAVLTERVIQKLKNGISINNLLILTFTNDAAHEMKDRIRDAITKDDTIKSQLDYIDSSYISTFDSFSLSIVKKYGYLLNLGNNIGIIDPSILYLEKKRIIEDIFDKLYKDKKDYFLNTINDLTLKNDETIKNSILNISNLLDLKYNKIEYLDNYINNYYSLDNINKLLSDYINLLIEKIEDVKELLKDFSHMVDSDYFNNFESVLLPLLSSNDYESIKNNLNFKLPEISKAKDKDDLAKDTKDSISDIIKNLKELTEYDQEQLKEMLLSTKDYAITIIEIIKELDDKLWQIKSKMNMYDYSDISKMGIKILKENENVRNELKDYFHEIMIDEYQDTSDLQEDFISLIANNNVYVVGDVKQSIYGFRNANPYLFKDKYDNYSNNNGGLKIDLTKNFRSREEVVNDINTIFSHMMTDNIGGADYKKTHQMISGNSQYKEEGKTSQNSNLEVINYEFDPTIGFSKDEIEAFYIAQDIKNKIKNKYQVYDKKKEVLRDANYGDFTIIQDRKSSFELYKKIFQYFQIPLAINTASNLVEEDEIVLIKNIIKLLINHKEKKYDTEFKYAFVSISRSFLLEMSDKEIFEHISKNDYSSKLMDIINSIVEEMDILSLNEIINEIIKRFDFYSKFILVGDINSRINRLTSIINIFNTLSQIDYSIYDVYDYLSEIIEDGCKIEVKSQDDVTNSVRIINIHKSKGLEYPICYYSGLHRKFNKMDLNDRLLYSSKYGIITPCINEGLNTTFVKELYKKNYNLEYVSEEIRLFYVALTRAREKMIIVTSFPEKNITNIKNSLSFLDFLTYSKQYIDKCIKNIDINSLGLSQDYNIVRKTNYKKIIDKTNEKLNIVELNIENDVLLTEKISKETHNLIDKDIKKKLMFGTKIHEIFELIDFRNPSLVDLDIDDYYKEKINKFISLINKEKIINIYKEYEFLYEENNNIYHGIIDLILEYENHIKIIDYKLKNIDDENYIKQLNSYKNYISKKTNKKIEVYLFSIVSGIFEEIKEKK